MITGSETESLNRFLFLFSDGLLILTELLKVADLLINAFVWLTLPCMNIGKLKAMKTYKNPSRKNLHLSLKMLFFCLISVFIAGIVQGQSIPESAYSGMRWRQVGPYRAGWATVASGVPGQPNTYYFGGAGGGV